MDKMADKKTLKRKVSDEMKVWKLTFKNLKKELSEDPEKAGSFVMAVGSIAVGLGGLIFSLARKDDESCRIHDDFVGSYYVTDHPLNNRELLEVNRKLMDENINSIGEALDELGYLKDEKKRK